MRSHRKQFSTAIRRPQQGRRMSLFLGMVLALGGSLVWLSACNTQQGLRQQFGTGVRPIYGDVSRLLKNAHYFQLMGKPELAIRELEEASYRDPANLKVLDALAQCYDELGEFSRAQELYRAGLKLEPDNQALTNNLCYSLYLSGKYREAEKCFRETMAQQPGNETVRNNLGLLLTRQGRQEDAVSLWKEKEGEEGARKKLTQVLAAIRHEKGQPQAEPEKVQVAQTQTQPPAVPAVTAPPAPKTAAQPPVKEAAAIPQIAPLERRESSQAVALPASPGVEAKPHDAAVVSPGIEKLKSPPPAAAKPATPAMPAAPVPDRVEAAVKPAAPTKPTVPPVVPAVQAAKPALPAQATAPPEIKKTGVITAHIGPAAPRSALGAASARLEVLNANGVRRLASQTGRWLEGEGFNVVEVSNYVNFNLKETVIFCRPEAEEAARSLAKRLVLPAAVKVDADLAAVEVDLRLILGRSHATPASLWASERQPAPVPPVAVKQPEKAPARVPAVSQAAAPAPAKPIQVARPIRLTAEDLINTRIELRNGSGFTDVARQSRTCLSKEGFNVVGIANHIDFGTQRTVITYRAGSEKVARALFERFFPCGELRLQANLPEEVDVKVILGHDLKPRLEQLAGLAD